MDCFFAIASYKRADNQRTLAYFERLGIEKEKILVAVQTEDDFKEYTKQGIDKRVGRLIYREGKNVSDNRNTILDNVPIGEKVVLFDDDITAVCKLDEGKLKEIDTKEEFYRFLEYGFKLIEENHTVAFGLYPVANAFFMKDAYRERNIIIGTLFALINTEMRFNPEFSTKEDYEFSCRVIRKYSKLIRLDNYTCKAQHYTKGGCDEFWKDKGTADSKAFMLAKTYPDIIELNPSKPGEVKMAKCRSDGMYQESLF